jgi:hypothetical protein
MFINGAGLFLKVGDGPLVALKEVKQTIRHFEYSNYIDIILALRTENNAFMGKLVGLDSGDFEKVISTIKKYDILGARGWRIKSDR